MLNEKSLRIHIITE